MTQKSAAAMIVPPNKLADKVERLEGVSPDEIIAQADALVEEAAADYIDWVQDDLRALQSAVGRIATSGPDQARHIFAAYRVAADIRDQGAVCGYPLVTRVSALLCNFIDGVQTLDDRELSLVGAHIDTLNTIIAQRIKDDSPELARALVSDLEIAAKKLRA